MEIFGVTVSTTKQMLENATSGASALLPMIMTPTIYVLGIILALSVLGFLGLVISKFISFLFHSLQNFIHPEHNGYNTHAPISDDDFYKSAIVRRHLQQNTMRMYGDKQN